VGVDLKWVGRSMDQCRGAEPEDLGY
jgi:hypothetical protein